MEQEQQLEPKTRKGPQGPKPGMYIPFTHEEKEQVLAKLEEKAQVFIEHECPVPKPGKLLKVQILKMLGIPASNGD